MKFKHLAVTVVAALVSFVPVHNADAKDIVVTIKPLHSLVTGVVGNTGENAFNSLMETSLRMDLNLSRLKLNY
jgi:ABC-type Zn2+ transport system substrate-binding protein/surface adhesin